MEVHCLEAIADVAPAVHGKAHRDPLIALIHVEVADLLPGDLFAVQLDDHFPGVLADDQAGSRRGEYHTVALFLQLHLIIDRELKDGIQLLRNPLEREHLKTKSRFRVEGQLYQCCPVPPGFHAENGGAILQLVPQDCIQVILFALAVDKRVSFVNHQGIVRDHRRGIDDLVFDFHFFEICHAFVSPVSLYFYPEAGWVSSCGQPQKKIPVKRGNFGCKVITGAARPSQDSGGICPGTACLRPVLLLIEPIFL